VALYKDLLVQAGQGIHGHGESILHFREGFDRGMDALEQANALRLLRPAGKRRVLDVARQRTRLDITMRSCGPRRRAPSAGGTRNREYPFYLTVALILILLLILHFPHSCFFSAAGPPVRGGLLNFVAQHGRLFKILGLYGLGQALLQ